MKNSKYYIKYLSQRNKISEGYDFCCSRTGYLFHDYSEYSNFCNKDDFFALSDNDSGEK